METLMMITCFHSYFLKVEKRYQGQWKIAFIHLMGENELGVIHLDLISRINGTMHKENKKKMNPLLVLTQRVT